MKIVEEAPIMNYCMVINSCVKINIDDVSTRRIPNFELSQRKTNCFQVFDAMLRLCLRP